jgi:uncharacterized protein YtpQ (UPF0354 family)
MRVRALPGLVLAGLLALGLASCGGGGSSANEPLSKAAFKDRVAASIITSTDLQADPGFGLKVDVSETDGLDTVQLVLDDAFKHYRAEPSKEKAIVSGLVREAKTRMAERNTKRDLEDVRNEIMPMLKRRIDVNGAGIDPAVKPFHDLGVIYAVQTEHSFTVVTKEDVARWGQSLAEIDKLARANLERETNKDQKLLCEPSGSQKLCGWASGDGYDASRMLVPALRRQIVHELGGPAVYAVPLESVFVALTQDYATVIRPKVVQEFTTGKNPLSPDLFVERGGELVVLTK